MIDKKQNRIGSFVFMVLLSGAFLFPVFMVLMNSFKGKLYISKMPFAFPTGKMFAGFSNYINGIVKSGFIKAMGYSAFITVLGTLLIVLFTSMTAWYLIRVTSKTTTVLYYMFVFSMVEVANVLHLDNLWGILILYLGFGAGLSVFMLSGFVKSIPLDIEEAATIDGCTPIVMFFRVVFPILKPTAITVAILNAMWLWNDYLLPLLVIGNDYKTIPVAVQGVLTGSYGARDMGSLMAMLVLSIIPIIICYLSCQKYIIKGVVAGAVKG